MEDTSFKPFLSSKSVIKLYLSTEISLILEVQNFPTVDHVVKLVKLVMWEKNKIFIVDTYSMTNPLNFSKIL